MESEIYIVVLKLYYIINYIIVYQRHKYFFKLAYFWPIPNCISIFDNSKILSPLKKINKKKLSVCTSYKINCLIL